MNTSELEIKKVPKETSTKITGAEAVIKCLLEEGVNLVFGYPGGAIMPVYDSLYKYVDELTHVLVRHEQGAIHAAQGFARVTGKTGVCIATSGRKPRGLMGLTKQVKGKFR